MSNTNLISIERIEKSIYLIRGEKVMPDRDLAKLYGVPTGALNQAVRRNRGRFPADFMFQLTSAEVADLNRSQIVIGSEKQHYENSTSHSPQPLGWGQRRLENDGNHFNGFRPLDSQHSFYVRGRS